MQKILPASQAIREGLGSLPFVRDKDERDENGDAGDAAADAPTPSVMPASNRPAVLPDGSYATQVRMAEGFERVSWQVCAIATW